MESYKFSEYKKMQELSNLDRILGDLKKNRKEYAKLVFLLAVFTPKIVLAGGLNTGMGESFKELFDLLIDFAKYGCLFIGTKKMIEHMLIGANLREASSAGIQFYIFYLLLQLYPKLFGL